MLVEDDVGIPMGLAGLSNAGMHSNQNFGNAMRYDDLNPAGFDAKERLKVIDEEGIDIAVLYCGLGQALGGIQDPTSRSRATRCGTTGWPTGRRPRPSVSSAPR